MSRENLQLLCIDPPAAWTFRCESMRRRVVCVCVFVRVTYFSAFGIESLLIALRPSTCSSQPGMC